MNALNNKCIDLLEMMLCLISNIYHGHGKGRLITAH